MQLPLRIAVLDTDTPIPEFEAQYGTYGDCCARLLRNAGMTLNPPLGVNDLIFTKWDVEKMDMYPDTDDIDAIFIAGGRHNASDSAPWTMKLTEFARKVLLEQDRIRVIGVGFGHQIVGRALGCVLDRNSAGWEASITTVNLNEMGRKIYGRDHLNIMQLHRDLIVTLPVSPFPSLPNDTLEIIGDTDTCAVQGLYTPGKVITLQGHPEYDENMMKSLVQQRVGIGAFTQDLGRDAIMRASFRNDGVHVAATFLNFLLEP